MKVKILLVDDQSLFRLMLEEILKTDEEIEIVGSAANGEEALKCALLKQPDVVLMDIQMPIKSGIEALREFKVKWPQMKVVMLTTFEDMENILDAYMAGTDGYLVKDMKPEILKMAVKCIHSGLAVMHHNAHQYLSQIQKRNVGRMDEEKFTFGDIVFDGIDIEIIKLIAEGKTNKEIALRLNYSEGTIKNRVSNILSLTGLPDRTKISVFAIKHQII